MDDKFNFRAMYYEKVGVTAIEGSKQLGCLLAEEPVDKSKLQTYLAQFAIPSMYHTLTWQMLLDIAPIYGCIRVFVAKQWEMQYEDLYHAVTVLGYADGPPTEDNVTERLWRIHEIEEGLLPVGLSSNSSDRTNFIRIANYMLNIVDNQVDAFWLTNKLFKLINDNKVNLQNFVTAAGFHLYKEDEELYEHLVNVGLFDNLPFLEWFGCGFAYFIPETCIYRIWDKVIGGSTGFLVFISVCLLVNLRRRQLMKLHKEDTTGLQRILKKELISTEAELVCNKAIELCNKLRTNL